MTSNTSLSTRRLGRDGLNVSLLGLGCMGLSEFYGAHDDAQSLQTLRHALEQGINFFDTADIYGPFTNEVLVGQAFAGRRHEVLLATKCGIVRDLANPLKRGVDNTPAYIRASCEASLRRLGTETIDLYYLHRYNPDSAPIEESVGAMSELVREGKIRFVGLSEVSAATIERAARVHPLTAVQSEYSLWTRDPEKDGILALCRQLGIGFVPYSPLGRGFLTGKLRQGDSFGADDFRKELPRFQGKNFEGNLALLRGFEEAAAQRGVTPAQLALAWVLAQGENIVPIPGTRRREHLDELLCGAQLVLSEADLRKLSELFPADAVLGDRYYETMKPFLGR